MRRVRASAPTPRSEGGSWSRFAGARPASLRLAQTRARLLSFAPARARSPARLAPDSPSARPALAPARALVGARSPARLAPDSPSARSGSRSRARPARARLAQRSLRLALSCALALPPGSPSARPGTRSRARSLSRPARARLAQRSLRLALSCALALPPGSRPTRPALAQRSLRLALSCALALSPRLAPARARQASPSLGPPRSPSPSRPLPFTTRVYAGRSRPGTRCRW
jgi:hypothetical protein